METINANWYNRNELRRYPLVDGQPGTEGLQLPDGLIVDCSLWVPELAGSVVWVSSVMVTPNLVTVTLQAATPPSVLFTPIASISLVKPFSKYRPYQLNALYPGVTGWISFGVGIETSVAQVFNYDAGTEILPKKIQRYSGDVLAGVKKLDSLTVLTGLVNLKPAGDLAFRIATRSVDGGPAKQVLMIGLSQDGDIKATHERYLSKQSSRPENGNCTKQPILQINGVPPDCNGNITITFPPGILDTRHPSDNGIILDYTLGFVDVCVNNPGVRPREGKLCDLPVGSNPVVVVVPPVPPTPPLPPDYPNGNPFAVTVCEDFSTQLTEFLAPTPQPPWIESDITINDPVYGLQSKNRMQLNVTLRDKTWRLLRNYTNGDHRNRTAKLEVQFGSSLHVSDIAGIGTWDNVGMTYNYQSQTSYNFVSLIWLGHNAPGVPLANDPRNAMLVIGHKSISIKWLTPYGYDIDNPGTPTVKGLKDGHFIDTFKYVEIDPNKFYMLQLTTTEGPPGTTTALLELMEIDPSFTYVYYDSIVNVSSVINVAASSRYGIVSVAASDVFVSFLSVEPQIGCEPVIFQES